MVFGGGGVRCSDRDAVLYMWIPDKSMFRSEVALPVSEMCGICLHPSTHHLAAGWIQEAQVRISFPDGLITTYFFSFCQKQVTPGLKMFF